VAPLQSGIDSLILARGWRIDVGHAAGRLVIVPQRTAKTPSPRLGQRVEHGPHVFRRKAAHHRYGHLYGHALHDLSASVRWKFLNAPSGHIRGHGAKESVTLLGRQRFQELRRVVRGECLERTSGLVGVSRCIPCGE
jgi:hypothetical protein